MPEEVYDELYTTWKEEKENPEVQQLRREFYTRLASYLKKSIEESRMLDEKTMRARLMHLERKNIEKMVGDLFKLRFQKALEKIMANKILPEKLTEEEQKLFKEMLPSIESCQDFLKELLRGELSQVKRRETQQRLVRFIRAVPAIIGSDMKTYGPFNSEDIATLPTENARILIKQGAAVEIEVK